MHTLQQNQTVSETIAPPQSAMVSPTLTANALNEAVAVLLEAAENAEQKRRVVRKVRQTFLTLVLVLYATYIPLIFANISHRWSLGKAVLLALAYLVHVKTLGHLHTPKFLQNIAAGITEFPNEPRLLLPLIDTLHIAQLTEEKILLYSALTERLWNLPATDAALWLDDTRRAVLRNTLPRALGKMKRFPPGYFDDVTTDLAVAIMRTMAGLGDKKSVKVLEKIIKAETTTPNETVVRDAAREYLPALIRKIAEGEKEQKQLRLCLEEKIRDPDKVLGEFVGTLAPEPTKAVLVEFLRVQMRQDKFWGSCLYAGAFSIAVLDAVLLLTVLRHGGGFTTVTGFFFTIIINLMLSYARSSKSNPSVQKIACELSRNSGSDTRLLPLLLNAAQYGRNAKATDVIKKALARLLPLLQPGDAALVPPAQRAYLRSWLKLPRNKKKAGSGSQTLTIIALDALAAVGDTKSLPAAAQIARLTLHGNYHEAELHEAAVRCVAALEAREG